MLWLEVYKLLSLRCISGLEHLFFLSGFKRPFWGKDYVGDRSKTHYGCKEADLCGPLREALPIRAGRGLSCV